jgi:two-component system cell cycle response regulator
LSLQTRLFVFFIAIVVLPLGLAALLGQRILVNELEERTLASLRAARPASAAVYNLRVLIARDRAQDIASSERVGQLIQENRFALLSDFLEDWIARQRDVEDEIPINYVVVANPQGEVLSEALAGSNFLPSVDPPEAEDIVDQDSEASRLLIRAIVPIRTAGDAPIATLVAGFYLDNTFLDALSEDTGVNTSLFVDGTAVSSTVPEVRIAEGPVMADLGRAAREGFIRADLAGAPVYAAPIAISEELSVAEIALVMSSSQEPILAVGRTIRGYLVVLVILAAAGSALLGFMLARAIARPLRELSDGANAIAGGNYDLNIEVRSRDEVGQLARAFNEMSQRLSVHINELKQSREELKRALTRFAETLRSTHDLERMVELVLDTSLDTLRSERGMLMWMGPARDTLEVTMSRGIADPDFELDVGQGLAGYVAKTGEPIRIPNGDAAPTPHPAEPPFRTALSVPIFSEERVIGVLGIFDKEEGLNFTEADMGTLLSLADQAGVAIENVLLHEETKRQAITDGLTQTWNYRYFQMRYMQEIERSARFQRPFSLMVLDIDDFKSINDTHGHQFGDSVLIELAGRIGREIRDIDVLARYGGEEFLLILPETDLEGGLKTAEKVRRAVADKPFVGDPPVDVTVSLGVACFPEHGQDGKTLQDRADAAMYMAKGKGKNRVSVYGGESQLAG